MQTHFSSQTLAEIFRDLYHKERSGVLHLSRGELEKRVYFDRGMILFAESDDDDENLGPRLVGEGKISPGALAEARRNVSESKDLAQALINRGLIAKDTLAHTVRYIVEKVIRSVFQWEGGSARFSEGWLLQEIFESDVVSTVEILLRGISEMVGFEPVSEALRALDNALAVRRPSAVPIERLALSPTHGFVLSRIDGRTRLRDVLATLPPDEDDRACRFLYGLLVLGVVEFDPPLAGGTFNVGGILREHADQKALEELQERTIVEAYESVRDKNPFDVLGLAPGATREAIERAYEVNKAAFNRERFVPKVRDRLRGELAYLESRFVEAYLALLHSRQHAMTAKATVAATETKSRDEVSASDLLVRVEMDKTKTKMALEAASRTAEGYYQKARRSMREGDYHNAIQYGKLAISYSGEDARFYFLLAECQVRNPEARWQRMAERNYLRATELDPWNPDYWLNLGRFYKKRGLKLRAKKQFQQVLEIAPAHEDAQRELDALP